MSVFLADEQDDPVPADALRRLAQGVLSEEGCSNETEVSIVLVDAAQAVVDDTGGDFVPERRLRQQEGFKGVGVSGHLPDGLLRRPGQQPIAVELEMSTKGRRRLQQIVSGYAANMGLEEGWYFVTGQDVRHVVEEAAKPHDFIKVLDWRRLA